MPTDRYQPDPGLLIEADYSIACRLLAKMVQMRHMLEELRRRPGWEKISVAFSDGFSFS